MAKTKKIKMIHYVFTDGTIIDLRGGYDKRLRGYEMAIKEHGPIKKEVVYYI